MNTENREEANIRRMQNLRERRETADEQYRYAKRKQEEEDYTIKATKRKIDDYLENPNYHLSPKLREIYERQAERYRNIESIQGQIIDETEAEYRRMSRKMDEEECEILDAMEAENDEMDGDDEVNPSLISEKEEQSF